MKHVQQLGATSDAYTPRTPVNPQRRMWITATSVTGCAGLIATAIPFVASLTPSEGARAIVIGADSACLASATMSATRK